jgi:predicted phage-related endonuclease
MAHVAVQSEAEWLALRESFVGGSEVASLFYTYRMPDGGAAVRHLYEAPPENSQPLGCLSPYRTGYALWTEKAGLVMPADFSSERIDAGKFLEPALAAWASDKFKLKLRKVRRYHQHETVEGWGASLDYEVHGIGMPPVEFKNVDRAIFARDWMAEGDDIIAPPIHINLQLQHQMGACGADHGFIVACIGGNELKLGRIPRHEPTQTRIAEAITAFWAGVKAQVPPILVADYEAVSKAHAFGDKGAVADLSGVEGFPALCDRYLELKRQADELEVSLETAKGQIAIHLGEATKATAPGVRVSWSVIHRPEKVIPERKQEAKTYRGALIVTKEV